MKILVTGAAGYLGSVLVGELLRYGNHVTALDNLSSGVASLAGYTTVASYAESDASFRFVRGDARDPDTLRELLRGMDAVIPLAAIVGMPACDREPELARSVNVEAIRLLMRLRSTEQRIVFPNTNSGYGSRAAGTTHCTEETPLEPISLYGRLKCEAEAIVLEAENTVSLRLATVFGMSPRMRRDLLVNSFVWAALRTRRLEIYEGDAMRNYVHVQDVARAFRTMAVGRYTPGRRHGDSAGLPAAGVYNLGNDAINLSKLDLAKRIAHGVSDFMRFPFGFGVVVVERDGIDPDKRNYVVSSEKLARAGFVAELGLDEGTAELVAGYQTMPEFYA